MLASKHNNCEHCLRKRYISKDWYKEPLEMIRRMIHTDWYDYFDYSAVFGAQGRCPWIRWSLINAVLFHLQLSKACRPRGGPRKQWTQNRREMAELSWLPGGSLELSVAAVANGKWHETTTGAAGPCWCDRAHYRASQRLPRQLWHIFLVYKAKQTTVCLGRWAQLCNNVYSEIFHVVVSHQVELWKKQLFSDRFHEHTYWHAHFDYGSPAPKLTPLN